MAWSDWRKSCHHEQAIMSGLKLEQSLSEKIYNSITYLNVLIKCLTRWVFKRFYEEHIKIHLVWWWQDERCIPTRLWFNTYDYCRGFQHIWDFHTFLACLLRCGSSSNKKTPHPDEREEETDRSVTDAVGRRIWTVCLSVCLTGYPIQWIPKDMTYQRRHHGSLTF